MAHSLLCLADLLQDDLVLPAPRSTPRASTFSTAVPAFARLRAGVIVKVNNKTIRLNLEAKNDLLSLAPHLATRLVPCPYLPKLGEEVFLRELYELVSGETQHNNTQSA